MDTRENRSSMKTINSLQQLLGAVMVVGAVIALPLAGVGFIALGISKGIRELLCLGTRNTQR